MQIQQVIKPAKPGQLSPLKMPSKHDVQSIMSWSEQLSKMDVYTTQYPLAMKSDSTVQIDRMEQYFSERQLKPLVLADTLIKNGVTGFGNIQHDVENEIKPWVTTTADYDGAYVDGGKHGIGRMTYPNGDIYKGAFVKDKMHGMGTMLFHDGRYYKGMFANDIIKGKGIYRMSGKDDAIIVEATFENALIVPGTAKIQYANGELFEGRVNQQCKRDGPGGRHYYANGDMYEGAWHNDKRSGRGKLTFGEGGSFTGMFKDDEAHDGKLIDRFDNIFENDTGKGGYFLRGKLTGLGRARFTNGNEYVGEFKDGMLSGQGQLTYKELGSGSEKAVYVGNFRGNKRNGYGEMTWGNPNAASGSEIFKGHWHNDRRVKGWIRMGDGSEYEGDWKDDVMHGQGKLTLKPERKGDKGITYEGRFNHGLQEPEGKLFYPNGDVYYGQIQ